MELVTLSDGTEALFWPLLHDDRDLLAQAYQQLSPESRRRRFLAAVDRLTPQMLDQLVGDVDGIDHVALVLFAEVAEARFDPVGIGRIVRYPEDAAAADIAVTVADAWQGKGVATALMAELVKQRPAGVTHLVTEVLADNPASLAMLRRVGPTRVEQEGNGLMHVQVSLAEGEEWKDQTALIPQRRRRFPWAFPWRAESS